MAKIISIYYYRHASTKRRNDLRDGDGARSRHRASGYHNENTRDMLWTLSSSRAELKGGVCVLCVSVSVCEGGEGGGRGKCVTPPRETSSSVVCSTDQAASRYKVTVATKEQCVCVCVYVCIHVCVFALNFRDLCIACLCDSS